MAMTAGCRALPSRSDRNRWPCPVHTSSRFGEVGHGTVPYEQNTQQSPLCGRSTAPQAGHTYTIRQESAGIVSRCSPSHAGHRIVATVVMTLLAQERSTGSAPSGLGALRCDHSLPRASLLTRRPAFPRFLRSGVIFQQVREFGWKVFGRQAKFKSDSISRLDLG